MAKLFLGAGHSTDPNEDRGVIVKHPDKTLVEGVLTYDLVKNINRFIPTYSAEFAKNVVLDQPNTILKEAISFFKRQVIGKDYAVEFHFNAFNGKASGVEVMIPAVFSKEEKELATKLCEVISKTLNIQNRGVKGPGQSQHTRLGWMTLGCHEVLVEVCFIDNIKDANSYLANKDRLSAEIAETLVEYIYKN